MHSFSCIQTSAGQVQVKCKTFESVLRAETCLHQFLGQLQAFKNAMQALLMLRRSLHVLSNGSLTEHPIPAQQSDFVSLQVDLQARYQVAFRCAQLTSMTKAFLDVAKYANKSKSRVAPRLSELETKRYLMPLLMRRSSIPDPNSEGYISPCPGGHLHQDYSSA